MHATAEYETFRDGFDEAVTFLNDKLRNNATEHVRSGEVTDAYSYISANKPTSLDVYKFLASDMSQFPNISTLFRISLLIPPSTYVERGFFRNEFNMYTTSIIS